MDVKEAYALIGGNYENARARLMSDDRIRKYLLKFVTSPQRTLIETALSDGDLETAFRESHNLKGICANLSLDVLSVSVSTLVEALRSGRTDVTPLFDAVCRDYDAAVSVLRKLSDN